MSRTERTTIGAVWYTQDGVRKGYCKAGMAIVTITLPDEEPREGDRITIEQTPDNRWRLSNPVGSGG